MAKSAQFFVNRHLQHLKEKGLIESFSSKENGNIISVEYKAKNRDHYRAKSEIALCKQGETHIFYKFDDVRKFFNDDKLSNYMIQQFAKLGFPFNGWIIKFKKITKN